MSLQDYYLLVLNPPPSRGRQEEDREKEGRGQGKGRESAGERSGRQGKASHFSQEESPTRCCTDHMYLVVA